jgi:hypothetical protein
MQKIIFKPNNKYIRNNAKDTRIIILWNKLKNDFPDKFKTDNDIWNENRFLLNQHIEKYNCLPILSENNTEVEIRLIKYIERQKQNIRLKKGLVIKEPYYSYWQEFCIKFPDLKITYNEIKDENWKTILEEVIDYILTNDHKRPSSESTNSAITFVRLANPAWIKLSVTDL